MQALESDPLVIAKLGAGGDDYRFIPPKIRHDTVLISIDAATQDAGTNGFRKLIRVPQVVSGSVASSTFIERAWWGSSSLLEADPRLVAKYGLEGHYKVSRRYPVTTTTLPAVLAANGLAGVDALWTDLEGMDFAVIRSCEKFIESTLLIQSELRMEPFYAGEPSFHEVVAYLSELGFRLIDMRGEHWKPVSSVRDRCRNGVMTWADCTFINERRLSETSRIKLAILLHLVGHGALAAHLIERDGPEEARDEILAMVSHRPLLPRLRARARRTARALKWRIFGSPFPHVI